MKSKHIFGLFGIIAIAIVIIYSFSIDTGSKGYIEKLQSERKEKNEMLKHSADSPLTTAQKQHFDSLAYYQIDPDYNITADYNPLAAPQHIDITTSDGERQAYLKVGYAHFVLGGKQQKLTVLDPLDNTQDYLFIPFYDETSTRSTYGGGRYLEAELAGSNKIRLDFNTAYNPYCAYNHEYRCPLPPSENQIDVPVEAGEKLFQLND